MKLKAGAGIRHQFDPESVVAITGDVNYSYVHLLTGSQHCWSRSLNWFSERWPDLLRIHKHTLINLDHVHNYKLIAGRRPGGYVIMKSNLRLEVSRRRRKEVEEVFKQKFVDSFITDEALAK